MFTSIVTGKTSTVQLSYNPNDNLYEALIVKLGGEGEKPETKRIQDTDLNLLFKQVRAEAGDRNAMFAFRKFSREMGLGIKMLSQQRRAFLLAAKKDIKVIREALAKSRKLRTAKKAAEAKKPVAKKTVKKITKK